MPYDKTKRIDVIGELCDKYNEYHIHDGDKLRTQDLRKWAKDTILVIRDLLEYHEGRT